MLRNSLCLEWSVYTGGLAAKLFKSALDCFFLQMFARLSPPKHCPHSHKSCAMICESQEQAGVLGQHLEWYRKWFQSSRFPHKSAEIDGPGACVLYGGPPVSFTQQLDQTVARTAVSESDNLASWNFATCSEQSHLLACHHQNQQHAKLLGPRSRVTRA